MVLSSSKQTVFHSNNSLGSSEPVFISSKEETVPELHDRLHLRNHREANKRSLQWSPSVESTAEGSLCNLDDNKEKLTKHEDGLIIPQII